MARMSKVRLRAWLTVRIEQFPFPIMAQHRLLGRSIANLRRSAALTPGHSSQVSALPLHRYMPPCPGRSTSTIASQSLVGAVW